MGVKYKKSKGSASEKGDEHGGIARTSLLL
jgi:hypothetical protein